MMAILFNNTTEESTITLKSHTTLPTTWVVIGDSEKAGLEEIRRIKCSEITIPPRTALILVDDVSFDKLKLK